MQTTHKIALNTLVQIVGKIITASSTLIITFLVTRRFGPSGYGDYTIMITYPAFFWIIADFGFNAVVTREIVRDRDKSQSFFENLLILRFLLSLVLICIAWVILHFLNFPLPVKNGVTIALITLITISTVSTCNTVFQTNLRYDFSVIATGLGAILNLALVGLVIKSGGSLIQIVIAAVLGSVATLLGVLIFVSRFITWRIPKIDRRLWRYLLLTTFPVGLALIFNRIYFKIDSFLLYTLPLSPKLGLTNAEATGIYGAAYKVLEVILELPTFFMNAVYPVLITHFFISTEKALVTFQKAFDVLIIVALPLAFGTVVLAKPLMVLLGGVAFVESAVPLKILMVALISFYISSLFMWMIMVLGRQAVLAVIYGLGAVINLSLNLIFIPKFGYLAAATITGITEIFVLVSGAIVVFKTLRFFVNFSIFLKAFFCSLVMLIPVYAFKEALLPIPVFVGGVAYFSSLFLLSLPQVRAEGARWLRSR